MRFFVCLLFGFIGHGLGLKITNLSNGYGGRRPGDLAKGLF